MMFAACGAQQASATPTAVPPAAWANTAQLPLAAAEHWPDLTTVAQPLTDGTSRIYELCDVTPPPESRWAAGDAARARVDGGDGGWSLQQQIIHYPGDTWTMGQTADAVFTALRDALTNCASTAPGTQVTMTTPQQRCADIPKGRCVQLAAVIDDPDRHQSAHIYLSSPGSSVTELSVWSSGSPSGPWSAPGDAEVFAAMNPQLCTVWEC